MNRSNPMDVPHGSLKEPKDQLLVVMCIIADLQVYWNWTLSVANDLLNIGNNLKCCSLSGYISVFSWHIVYCKRDTRKNKEKLATYLQQGLTKQIQSHNLTLQGEGLLLKI